MIRIRCAIRRMLEWQQAKRDYRALCRQGRAPHVRFTVEIHPDDYEWTGLNGITGLKTTVPLTREGMRYIRRALGDIETTCIRGILEASRRAAEP
ncbi:hypothetical protein [Nonomuraea rhodomycinica]|uniref:Uncharacterized protein n=1 Tax=Nonomuraea rhodomycinica TaxID=1712872 RepID=A0A7Y6MEH5_9ACTN|nr:hypothetical protein [Nonomuraea rhodomycinica]NUW45573.1 hypothetical protein [Nonomuraea rhodomycinica]